MTTAMPAMQADLARCGALVGAPEQKWQRIAVVGCTLVALAVAGAWVAGQHRVQLDPEHARLLDSMVALALVVYVLAMALPFVPGIEIGLALMMLLGEEGIVLVYVATQLALALSFALGRWVPARQVAAAFRWLGMDRAACLLQSGASFPSTDRGGLLGRRAGLALAVALNLPGNAVIGGAGGIGMLAGMSRAIPAWRYVLLVAAATTPVPAFLLLRAAT